MRKLRLLGLSGMSARLRSTRARKTNARSVAARLHHWGHDELPTGSAALFCWRRILLGVSNLAQTISESWRTLTKMGSTEICKKRAEEAHTRAEQSVYPSEQEAWLRVASEWSKLAQTCDHPINGVMGPLRRLYSGRSPQFP